MRPRDCMALFVVLLAACGGGGGGGAVGTTAPAPGPTPPPPVAGPPASPAPGTKPFVDVTQSSSISYRVDITLPSTAHQTGQADLIDMTFGGAAVGDCDNDGDLDLFVTSGDIVDNGLYINQLIGGSGAPLQFAERANSAGVARTREDGLGNYRHSGPVFVDIDGDGHLDLFMGALFGDPLRLYRNNGDCTFTDVTIGSGLDTVLTDHTITGGFGDYDLDGDLDLMLSHWGSSREDVLPAGVSEHLFRNDSTEIDGIRFTDVSVETGVSEILIAMQDFSTVGNPQFDYTLTPLFGRINDDLWPDIAVAADFATASLLINDIAASGTFVNRTNPAVHSIDYGMGAALGDVNFDGRLDWFVTSIFGEGYEYNLPLSGNRLLLNPGGDFSTDGFQDITVSAGVADGRWGWSACFLDIDNDGDLDIYHTNGWPREFGQASYADDRSRVFLADSSGTVFTETAADFGLDDNLETRGGSCADFDNDGDVDIFLTTREQDNSGILWENESAASGNNFLRVRLVGLPPNTEASGARIFATNESRTQMREIIIGNSYTAQNPAVQIFGLSTNTQVDELRVEWPPLDAGGTGNPTQPPEWRKSAVPASAARETLVICHPELPSPPAECAAPD